MRPLAWLIVLALAPLACAQDGTLVLRAFEAPPPGEPVAADAQGVRVRTAAGDTVVVGWDRVLRLPEALAAAGEPHASLALDAWRARTRVERGDLVLAEPLLESLFASHQPLRGPTGLVIAEGLLRARLARGAGESGIEAWLAWLDANVVRQPRTTFANALWARQAGLPAVIDADTELCPALAPMWLGSASLQLVLDTRPAEGEREKASAMRAYYQAAARHEMGQPVASLPDPPRERASELVRDIVAARVLGEAERAPARARLESALKQTNSAWLSAWLRAGIGRSLVLESDPDMRLRGVAELLRVHVLHRGDAPFLADIALAEAAAVLDEFGFRPSAIALAHELSRLDPRAAVLSWPGVARLLDAPAGGAATPDSTQPQTTPETVGGPT